MNQETIFSIVNGIALISWIILLIVPFRPITNKIILGVSITILCVAYAVLLFQTLQPTDFQKFGTLEGITSLQSVPGAVLVGWIHYLAFDLMAGLFIANNASKHGIRHIVIVPALLGTFMMGPVGLLLYLIIRWAITKHWFAKNF